jgi:hypothetical protein
VRQQFYKHLSICAGRDSRSHGRGQAEGRIFSPELPGFGLLTLRAARGMPWTPLLLHDNQTQKAADARNAGKHGRTRIEATAVSLASTRTMTRHACIKRRRRRLNPMGDESWSVETCKRHVQCGWVQNLLEVKQKQPDMGWIVRLRKPRPLFPTNQANAAVSLSGPPFRPPLSKHRCMSQGQASHLRASHR